MFKRLLSQLMNFLNRHNISASFNVPKFTWLVKPETENNQIRDFGQKKSIQICKKDESDDRVTLT